MCVGGRKVEGVEGDLKPKALTPAFSALSPVRSSLSPVLSLSVKRGWDLNTGGYVRSA